MLADNRPDKSIEVEATSQSLPADALARPTTRFRRRAWLEFQRAIDPLAAPKPLRLQQPH